MTLDNIIKLFEELESGKNDQVIGYHLHTSINKALLEYWPTNDNYSNRFSGFLKALQDSDYGAEK